MLCILPFTTQHRVHIAVRVCDIGCTDCRSDSDRNVQLISNCTQTLSVLNYAHINPRGSSLSAGPGCLLALVLLWPDCGWRWGGNLCG